MICFVSNWHKTIFFDSICEELSKSNIDVYWIVVNEKYKNTILKKYDSSKVLFINTKHNNDYSLEIDDFKLNELIYGDRYLKHFNYNDAYSFLRNIQKPIYEFIKNNNIKYIFGENTYAHEILINRILKQKKELKAKYLEFIRTRMPSSRTMITTDEFQNNILDISKINNSDNYDKIVLSEPTFKKVYDKHLINSQSFLNRFKRIKRFFTQENNVKYDPSNFPNIRIRSKEAIKQECNRFSYKFIKTYQFSEEIKKRPYFLYALHRQPEASSDVKGRYYDNQIINIYNICRILPPNYILLVKEHTNAIGDRSYYFYKKIIKMNNVILINENINSRDLIKYSKAVFTISGTIGYEAALMGIPSFSFAPTFYNKLNGSYNISIDDLRQCMNFKDLFNSYDNISKMNLNEFSKFLYTNSFHGLIGNVSLEPNLLDLDNISAFSNIIKRILRNNV
tara:strand:+ start:659 stop:2011 length:1353 start_codon:yes stop_codon:yes gene_type:complete